MSNTHTLYCEDCKVKHWAGQSNYLYPTAVKFLHEHAGHALKFDIDGCEDFWTYKDYKETRYE